jgi:hypothetical protein
VFNFVADQPVRIEAAAGNGPMATLAVRHGSAHFQNIYQVGGSVSSGRMFYSAGLGLGAHITFDRVFIDIDGVCSQLFEGAVAPRGVQLMVESRLAIGYQLFDRFALFAGFGLNTMITQSAQMRSVAFGPMWTTTTGDTLVALWPGVRAGVRL